MVNITQEKLDRLRGKRDREEYIMAGIAAAVIIAGFILYSSGSSLAAACFFGLISVSLCTVMYKIAFPPGNTERVMSVYNTLRYDYLSDNTVSLLIKKAEKTRNFADKTMLTLFLCDVYRFRGEIDKALAAADRVDRKVLPRYPAVAMNFYNCIMCLYDCVNDSENVLAAYSEGEALIDKCAFKNLICGCTVLDTLVMAEKARGNYKKALEMKLMRTRYQIFPRQLTDYTEKTQGSALMDFIVGAASLSVSELFYLSGGLETAERGVNYIRPTLSPSKYYLQRANELSERINQAKQTVTEGEKI